MKKLMSWFQNKEKKKISYSQCGEDLILSFVFSDLRVERPSYIDIGTNHPVELNNTYLFYSKGSKGICIEPDSILYREIIKKRKNDVCINAGIGIDDQTSADFYVMSTRTLNTFSRETAQQYVAYGNLKIEEIVQVPLISLNSIMKKHFIPDYISLDVEGFEMPILESIDFTLYRPKAFCIETLTYTENKTEEKIVPIIDFMTKQGYFVYGDTYINSIFVDKKVWKQR